MPQMLLNAAAAGFPRLAAAPPPPASEAVETVRAVLALPDDQLDYARAKLAFDKVIDPSIDEEWVLAELDRMTVAAQQLAGPNAGSDRKLAALRTLIYKKCPWNKQRPFEYDHSNWKRISSKLLHHYLKTRRGQCVSMPILFLILAERLGLDIALATSPEHVFVRHREESGRVVNLETTNGAHPARDEWIRSNCRISDLSLKNGLYLRSLSRREAVAHMASTVNEHLMGHKRYNEVIALSEVILRHWPRDIHALLSLGSAYGHLRETEFKKKYPDPACIPPHLRQRCVLLGRQNEAIFAAAEALGWEPEEDEEYA